VEGRHGGLEGQPTTTSAMPPKQQRVADEVLLG
jgi:hypothetical protein